MRGHKRLGRLCAEKMAQDRLRDARAGPPVAIGVDGLGHPVIGGRIVQQLGSQTVDLLRVRAGELDGAGSDGLRPLRLAPEHEHGFSECGCFLLNAAGIGHDHVTARHEPVHVHGVKRRDEPDVRHAAEQLLRRAAHDRAQVHGIDDLDIRIVERQAAHGGEDVAHGLAVVLAPMAGHGDDPARKIDLPQFVRDELLPADGVGHGVDHGVAGDENVALHGLALEVVGVVCGRCEVQRGNAADERAVHLLREGRPAVVRAQTGLDMADGDLGVKRGERAGKRRRGVAVDKHDVRLHLTEHFAHPLKHARCDRGQILPLLHDVEIVVGTNAETVHDGVEHFPVLRRDAHDALDLGMLLQLQHERRHFDRFRPRAENGHDFNAFAHR